MNLLKQYIQLVLSEAKIREAEITGDKRVPFGSEAHIKDLEKRIADLTYWRNKNKKGTENRANYSRLISRLKNELNKARKNQM